MNNLYTIKIFKDRIVCPRCDGNGNLYRMKADGIDNSLIVCDECEATWDSWNKIWEPHVDFNEYLGDKGISYTTTSYSEPDYMWFRDESLRISDSYYECPLLNILIWMGDCYDINMFRNNYVKESVLESVEKEIGYRIDKNESNIVCGVCVHGF